MSSIRLRPVRQYVIVTDTHAARSARTRRWLRRGFCACLIGLAACSGGEDIVAGGESPAPIASTSEDLAETAAAENLPLLQPATDVSDFEVLNVADGSISTLRDEVAGDRPVLLWFFSPH